MNGFKSIEFKDDKLVLIDQTQLPIAEDYIETDDYERIAVAIERLEVRGAPAIGIAAAYAVALSFKKIPPDPGRHFKKVFERLASTRPTAVNLFWALDSMKAAFENHSAKTDLYTDLLNEAIKIHEDDKAKCESIAVNGLQIFKDKINVVTHCNTGRLATGGDGTAFNVIKKAFELGLIGHVYADETRPLLQGSRLTAFELEKAGIPFSIISDSAAAFLMQQKKIDLAVVGADRIAKNGDTANKIGTYNLAVSCRYHHIPFFVAAPSTTIDMHCPDGSKIKIELRDKKEVNSIRGMNITKDYYDIYAPAFDITPADLISGIITEVALFRTPYDFNV